MNRTRSTRRRVMWITLATALLALGGGGPIDAQVAENPNRPAPDAKYLWWQLPPSEGSTHAWTAIGSSDTWRS